MRQVVFRSAFSGFSPGKTLVHGGEDLDGVGGEWSIGSVLRHEYTMNGNGGFY